MGLLVGGLFVFLCVVYLCACVLSSSSSLPLSQIYIYIYTYMYTHTYIHTYMLPGAYLNPIFLESHETCENVVRNEKTFEDALRRANANGVLLRTCKMK